MTRTIDDETLARLEKRGHRWTKAGKDRIYYNPQDFGLEIEYYKTGNPRIATWRGEGISNAEARRIMGCKVWFDLEDGKLHARINGGGEEFRDAVGEYVDGVLNG